MAGLNKKNISSRGNDNFLLFRSVNDQTDPRESPCEIQSTHFFFFSELFPKKLYELDTLLRYPVLQIFV
jgi:hypothetical protein